MMHRHRGADPGSALRCSGSHCPHGTPSSGYPLRGKWNNSYQPLNNSLRIDHSLFFETYTNVYTLPPPPRSA